MRQNEPIRARAGLSIWLLAAALPSIALLAVVPLASADDTVDGQALYVNNCAACHGLFGEGDGPVAAALRVAVPNLRTLQERHGGVFPVEAVTAYIDGRQVPVAHGNRVMPIWGDVFGWTENGEQDPDTVGQRRIEAVVAFLQELQYR